MAEPTITLNVTRYRPEKDREPTTQTYVVPYRQDWVVLDALNHIKDQMDGTLSYRWSCRMGVCGSCGMMVNGTPKLTCAAFLRDYYPQEIRVEPLVNFPIIRDLVIDMTDFMEKLKSVKPWIIRKEEKPVSEGEYLQTPAELEAFHQFTQCINCMLCYAACPVYGLEPKFLGQHGLARPGKGSTRNHRQPRWHLGLHLCRGMQRRLSQACGSGRGDPALQSRRYQKLVSIHPDAVGTTMTQSTKLRGIVRLRCSRLEVLRRMER
jgi:succinate dehydrogenase/fumarate reductase iron-sulfur protein